MTLATSTPLPALPPEESQDWYEHYSALDQLVRGWASEVLYVDPVSGNDLNDGSATGYAVKTVGEAVRRAEAAAQQNNTVITIRLAAGTYSEQVRPADSTSRNLVIRIEGPAVGHPNVPTAVFTRGAAAGAIGIFHRNPSLILTVADVHFIGFRGTTSSAGVSVYGAPLFCVNVHATDCYYGVSSQRGDLDVKGGIFTNAGRLQDNTGTGAGIRSLMLNRHAIGTQNAGSLDNGPIFRGCYVGVFAQEGATGHVDWCTFEDNDNGVIVRVNSRANVDGSSFKRNTVGIVDDSNGHVFISDNTTFGTGADANATAVIARSGGRHTSTKFISGVELAYGRSELAADGVYTAQTITGTTGVTDLYNRTLKAPFWGDASAGTVPPRRLRVKVTGALAGTAGTKTLNLRLGSALVGATFAASEVGTFTFDGAIHFVSPTRQLLTSESRGHLMSGARLGLLAASVDMTTDQAVRVTGTLGAGTDSITVELVELSWA